ncbi:MAG: anaerobic ribonucleoside-triphosphate reductase [Erysipelotrichaceae bacterium]
MNYSKIIEGTKITSNEDLSDNEYCAYIAHIKNNNPRQSVEYLDLVFEADDVNMSYRLRPVHFEKIRRITGYLVGTMDHWNNAKTAEESDRVKHA